MTPGKRANGAAGEIQLTRTAGHWRIDRITVNRRGGRLSTQAVDQS
ncbi:hypothetical protein [Streptosporangium sp. NPDC002721]